MVIGVSGVDKEKKKLLKIKKQQNKICVYQAIVKVTMFFSFKKEKLMKKDDLQRDVKSFIFFTK